jgi:hypothetical protein
LDPNWPSLKFSRGNSPRVNQAHVSPGISPKMNQALISSGKFAHRISTENCFTHFANQTSKPIGTKKNYETFNTFGSTKHVRTSSRRKKDILNDLNTTEGQTNTAEHSHISRVFRKANHYRQTFVNGSKGPLKRLKTDFEKINRTSSEENASTLKKSQNFDPNCQQDLFNGTGNNFFSTGPNFYSRSKEASGQSPVGTGHKGLLIKSHLVSQSSDRKSPFVGIRKSKKQASHTTQSLAQGYTSLVRESLTSGKEKSNFSAKKRKISGSKEPEASTGDNSNKSQEPFSRYIKYLAIRTRNSRIQEMKLELEANKLRDLARGRREKAHGLNVLKYFFREIIFLGPLQDRSRKTTKCRWIVAEHPRAMQAGRRVRFRGGLASPLQGL